MIKRALRLVSACAMFWMSCNSDDTSARVDICAQSPLPGCGALCATDGECMSGLHCATSGRCIAHCLAGGQGCLTGESCDPSGRCVSGPSNGDAGAPDASVCVGLQCQQVDCTGGTTTTLTGKVYTPAGDLPLYNAIVYVPNGPLQPFAPGVSCDACGAVTSGSPIASAITGPDGSFSLQNVPAGDNIPLVIQVGRWRRQVTIPKVDACVSAPITDVNMLRLPRTQAEGDIPKMAIATGSADPFECLLRKVGIADSEITLPSGSGRVHFYRQNGKNMNPSAPAASTLWGSVDKLKEYDVVMLPCEGAENKKSGAATQALIDYTDAGGRLFATHFSYVWIAFAQQPWPTTGNWMVNQPHPPDPFPFTGTIDTSFPKGQAFSQWLSNVGATPTMGQLDIVEARHDINAVNDPPARKWIDGTYGGGGTPNAVLHLTYNTPINPTQTTDAGEPLQCGRVVFSDFHVSASALSGQSTFPASCKNNDPLTAQEKALVFMLFDLSACVQSDDKPPEPPSPPIL